MGSYGIGIERILCAAIELYHDKDGMVLPAAIAPFQVVVTPANNADAAQAEAARGDLSGAAWRWGWTRCWTTATSGPGVKFKDADLIGVPFRVVVGKKLAGGLVELVERKTRQATDVAVEQAAAVVKARLWGKLMRLPRRAELAQNSRGERSWPRQRLDTQGALRYGPQNPGGNAIERQNFDGAAHGDGLLRHAEDDAAVLVLRDGVRAGAPHGRHFPGAIGAHAGQNHAHGVVAQCGRTTRTARRPMAGAG